MPVSNLVWETQPVSKSRNGERVEEVYKSRYANGGMLFELTLKSVVYDSMPERSHAIVKASAKGVDYAQAEFYIVNDDWVMETPLWSPEADNAGLEDALIEFADREVLKYAAGQPRNAHGQFASTGYKDSEFTELINNHSKGNLTAEEKAEVDNYVRNGTDINLYLREGITRGAYEDEQVYEQHAKSVQDYLYNQPRTTENLKFQRYQSAFADFDLTNGDPASLVGKTFQTKGFFSTSALTRYGFDVIVDSPFATKPFWEAMPIKSIVNVPKGSVGSAIGAGLQAEFLLPFNSTFRVASADKVDGKLNLVLDLVGQDAR